MTTHTTEAIADKNNLIQAIELLSDRAVLQVKEYVERIREEELELEEIDAEIANSRAERKARRVSL